MGVRLGQADHRKVLADWGKVISMFAADGRERTYAFDRCTPFPTVDTLSFTQRTIFIERHGITSAG